jgi:TonB family protein
MKLKELLNLSLLLCWSISFCGSAAGQNAPPAPGQPVQRIQVPEAWAMGNLIDTVAELQYPEDARKQHVGGKVVLKILIDKDGEVRDAVPVDEGSPLAGPAAEAVKKWKFRPYIRHDQAMEVESTATLEFVADTGEIKAPKPLKGPPRLRVSSGVAEGLILRKVDPVYPLKAKADHIQGDVMLAASIDTEGNIKQLTLLSGHPLLAESAFEAVKQWKYKPFLLNGTPVEVDTQIRITYRL